MGSQHLAPSAKEFAEAAVATLLVAGVPVAIVWWLRASGAVSSGAVGVLLGMGLSLAVSWVACLVWERRTGSEDLLFSELMIWGFLHRWRTQRRLASARELLGLMSEAQRSAANGLGTEDPVKLLERLVARMETRDPYLHGHSRRVARHSWMIAKRMGLPRAQVARIRTAAAIHDVGKINTPRTILHKTGPLTAEEFDVIKRHPGDGARMAAVLRDAELIAMVRDHHERLDGSGYPSALLGDEIAVGARIIAVADTFDAITSARPYRSARTHKQAIEILKQEAGTKLDPAAVRAFCSHYAGRHPLALWSAVAGIPERMLSWLGGSLAGVASLAKVVAVAALVGGAAVTSSTLGLPAPKPKQAKAHPAPAVYAQAYPVHSTSTPLLSQGRSATPRTRRLERVRPAVMRPSLDSRTQSPQPATPSTGTVTERPAQPGAGSGQGTGPGKGNPGEPPAKGKPGEPPAKGKPGEPPAKGKPGEPPAKGKPEEPPAKGKPEEPPAKGKPEEPPAKGAPEQPPVKGKP